MKKQRQFRIEDKLYEESKKKAEEEGLCWAEWVRRLILLSINNRRG